MLHISKQAVAEYFIVTRLSEHLRELFHHLNTVPKLYVGITLQH